jgi:hypothetical protein
VRDVPLVDKVVLPLRSVIDTATGVVRVTSALTARRAQTITLYDGAFTVGQARGARPVTELALQDGDFTSCPAATPGSRAARAAAGGGKAVRRLWASGKGSFRTRGRYASAAVRGTKWLTEDRCDGTLIRVASGAVAVADRVRRKTVVVKAGKSYLARAAG